MEPLEDAASLVCRDAVAVVADDEQGDEPVRDSGDLDVAATGRELQGVRDEVREHLLDPATIARRDAEARRQRGRETDLPADRDRQERGRDLAAGLGDRERPELEIDGARLDPGDLQQVADELGHRPDDRPAALEEVTLDGGVGDLAVQDQPEISAEARERGPQLVRHGRDERRPLGVPRPQLGELALVGDLARHQCERDARVASHRRRQPVGDPGGVGRSHELESERDVAGRRNGKDREMPGAPIGAERRNGAGAETGRTIDVAAAVAAATHQERDRRATGGRAAGSAPRCVRVQPCGECLCVGGIFGVVQGDNRAPLRPVGDHRSAARSYGPREDSEKPGEPLLGRPVPGQHVERAREQDPLLMREPVLGAARAAPALGVWSGCRRRNLRRTTVGAAFDHRERDHRGGAIGRLWPGSRRPGGRKYRRGPFGMSAIRRSGCSRGPGGRASAGRRR